MAEMQITSQFLRLVDARLFRKRFSVFPQFAHSIISPNYSAKIKLQT